MKNKKVKGFTLIELIIVMAVFSVIMFGALQLIEPTSRIYTRSYNQENASAAVDNIKRYLEEELRYAEAIRIQGTEPTQEELVDFVNDYYNGKVYYQKKSDFDKLETVFSSELNSVAPLMDKKFYNKVTELTTATPIINWEPLKLSVTNAASALSMYRSEVYTLAQEKAADGTLKNPAYKATVSDTSNYIGNANGDLYVLKIDNSNKGRISQKQYKYLAGDVCYNTPQGDDPSNPGHPPTDANGVGYFYYNDSSDNRSLSSDDIPTLVKEVGSKSDAVNKAMYETFNFNFSLGMYQLNTATNMLEYDSDFYSNFGQTGMQSFQKDNFAFTITTYPADGGRTVTTDASGAKAITYDSAYTTTANISLTNIKANYLNKDFYAYTWLPDSTNQLSYKDMYKTAADVYTGAYNFAYTKDQLEAIKNTPEESVFYCDIADKTTPFNATNDQNLKKEPDTIYIIYSYCGQGVMR